MSYKVPPLEESTSILVALWKAFFPLSNVGSRFSYHWKRLRAYAGGKTDIHAHVDSAQDDVMPDTSTGNFLTRWGNIFKVFRKGATGARRANALRVLGTAGKTVSVGDQLLHEATGFFFEVISNGTVASNGQVDVGVQAISTGAATRLLAGETLKFTSAPDGIQPYAKLVLDLNEDGFDSEQDPAYSRRVNDRIGNPNVGGNQIDFVLWCRAQTGISTAFCYPHRAGVGTIDIAAFKAGNGSSRALTSTERATLLTALKKLAPAQLGGFGGGLRVLTTIPDGQSVEITLLTNGDDGYNFDWTDSTAPVVTAYTPATRTVQFTAPRPSSMLAGHRVLFKGVASAQDGRVFTIEQLVSTDSIILKETPSVNLAATDIAYAGGPLTTQIRDAVAAHMNGEIVYADNGKPVPESALQSAVRKRVLAEGIGPSNPFGVSSSFPNGQYGTWNGALLRGELFKIAAYSLGVRNVTIVTPAVDYSPAETTFPNDGNVNYIAPSSVVIRRAW